MLNRFVKISLLSSCLLFFSCNDLKNISNQMESIKGDLDQIIMKQADLDKKMALLQSAVKNIKVASNKPPADNKPKKRKTPNPNYAHNIDVGGSVLLGNPNAKVTITKFTDFQ